ncbi:uncharacterized protein PHACADRAFT_202654 [Phanerochaete carnosa HHB-10118-sp]|uniref:Uncharacterized protein n=1 Tax=Phanerochaete carnosa (strain HHB-10118-sp) TaxID=650164 RepID=K5VPQ8_PHACS|nr:uncharacterized protein PHACADRAFT_202654 [Phanerochaete carnosa HHB-10118-sp]EKM48569.1 hypothetical protein PHACADRAFT_202654 [Phanerochaete carnosa HHB-10118-sp]
MPVSLLPMGVLCGVFTLPQPARQPQTRPSPPTSPLQLADTQTPEPTDTQPEPTAAHFESTVTQPANTSVQSAAASVQLVDVSAQPEATIASTQPTVLLLQTIVVPQPAMRYMIQLRLSCSSSLLSLIPLQHVHTHAAAFGNDSGSTAPAKQKRQDTGIKHGSNIQMLQKQQL